MKSGSRLHRLQKRWSRLPSTERGTIRQWARLSTDRPRWLRSRILFGCLASSSYRGVARQAGCSDGIVRRAVDRFLDHGIDRLCAGRRAPPGGTGPPPLRRRSTGSATRPRIRPKAMGTKEALAEIRPWPSAKHPSHGGMGNGARPFSPLRPVGAQAARSPPPGGMRERRTAVAPATAHQYPRRAPAGRDAPPARTRPQPRARGRFPGRPRLLPAASRGLAGTGAATPRSPSEKQAIRPAARRDRTSAAATAEQWQRDPAPGPPQGGGGQRRRRIPKPTRATRKVGPPSRRRRRISTPAGPRRGGTIRQPARLPGHLRKGAFLASRAFSQRRPAGSPAFADALSQNHPLPPALRPPYRSPASVDGPPRYHLPLPRAPNSSPSPEPTPYPLVPSPCPSAHHLSKTAPTPPAQRATLPLCSPCTPSCAPRAPYKGLQPPWLAYHSQTCHLLGV